jgi:hypothetical protein
MSVIMATVILRFYEELNRFLPEHLRKRDFEFEFKEEATIQAIIERQGVPSEEVDLILAEGQSIGFDHVAHAGERISIYPVFESINIAEVTCLPCRPLRSTKFVLDSDLEELAGHMTRVGYDVRFDSCNSWSEIMEISEKERRIILTSNPALLKSKEVTHAILLPSTAPEIQLRGIMDRLEIHPREICLSS